MATDPAASSASKQSQLLRPQSADDRSGFARWLPGLQMLRWYRPDWLKHDIVAGLVLATMLVPVGIAAVILAVVLPLSGGDPLRAIALASAMAIVSGAVCVGAGLIKLGFITELLSKPIRYGYMNGIALTVLLSQVPKLLGFSVESHGPLLDLWSIANGVIGGRVNWTAFLIGAGALATIFALKQSKVVPGLLVAVAGATAIVGIFELSKSAGVPVLGPLPQGLPSFAIPWINVADFTAVLSGGLAVALISFADTSVLSRAYAARTRTYVDPNQELVGLGAANLAAGFFQGFPISSSSSRTPVAEAAGAKTQLTGVFGAVAVALLIIAAPNLLQNLPTSALAAVVIASAIGLIEIQDLIRIYKIQRWEFWLSMLCFAGVAVFGAIPGIAFAVIIAVIEFLWDGWRPHSAILGRADGVSGYHDISRYPQARLIPGLVLFRWDAPLFFANAELFQACVIEAVENSPTPVHWVVVAAEPVTSVDVTAADVLSELEKTLREAGIKLSFAELKDPVKDKLKRFGLFTQFGEQSFFPTIGSAVKAYLTSHPVDWVDWQDRRPSSS